jgi:hypothetical protein
VEGKYVFRVLLKFGGYISLQLKYAMKMTWRLEFSVQLRLSGMSRVECSARLIAESRSCTLKMTSSGIVCCVV